MTRRISVIVSLSALALASCALLSGCARQQHIRKDFGVKTHEFFRRQQAPSKKAPVGLDSEEAALIHKSYRMSLGNPSGQATRDKGSQVLLVQEPRGHGSRR